jgi:autotransporter-associated beta strand protein
MAATVMATPVVHAQTTFNNGNGTASWNDAGNWNNGVPAAGVAAILGAPTVATPTITLGGGSLAGSLQFSDAYTLQGGDLTLNLAGGNITVDPALTGTINSVLAGTSGLTVNPTAGLGTGTLVLGGANTFTGGVAVQAGTLRFANDSALGAAANSITLGTGSVAGGLSYTGNTATISRAIALGTSTSGSGVINVATAGQTLTLSGVISGGPANSAAQATLGDTALIITGPGTVALTGANTFTGNIVVDGAGFNISADAQMGATANNTYKTVTLQNGATLNVNFTYDPSSGANTANKRFAIGTGGGTINVASGFTLTLNDGSQLSGSTTLTKSGPGNLVLDNQAFNYTGPINVTAGTLQVSGNAGTLGTVNTVVAPITVAAGATYDLRISQTSQRPLTLGGVGSDGFLVNGATTNATVNAPAVTLAGNATFGGVGNLTIPSLDGGGATRVITRSGTGMTNITAGSNFTGTTTVNIDAGGGIIAAADNVFGSNAVITTSGAFAQYGQSAAALPGYTYNIAADSILAGNSAFFNSLTVGGNLNRAPTQVAQTAVGANLAAAAKFGFANDASRFFAIAGGNTENVTVGTGTPWAGISNDNSTGRTYSGTITANSDFVLRATNGKSFTIGTTTLTPASPRTVTLAGGTVLFSSATSNYNNNVTFVVSPGATVQPTTSTPFGTSTIPANNPAIVVQPGATFNPNGGVQINNVVTIQPGGILLVDDGNNLAGTGSYVQSAGSIMRLVNSTGLGGTVLPNTVPGSIVRLEANNATLLTSRVDPAAIISVTGGTRTLVAGTALQLNSAGPVTIGAFNNIPTGVITNDGSSRVLNNNTTTAASTIAIGANGATFVATDGTTLTLAGTGSNPSAGSLAIEAGAATVNIGVASPVIIDGLNKGNTNGAVVYSGPTDSTTTPTIGFRAGAVNVLSGSFTHGGGGAHFQIGGNGTFDNASGTGLLSVHPLAAFNVNTGVRIDAQVNVLALGTARMQGAGGDNTTATVTVSGIQGAGTITLGNASTGTNRDVTLSVGANNVSSTFSGLIADADATRNGGLTKVGTGTLTLAGTNTYTLNTTVSAGVLQLGNGGATGSVAGAIVNNATLAINRGNNFTLAGVISGTGTVTKAGGGVVTLSAAPTYTGATTINGGGITLTTGTSFPTSSLTVAGGARLSYLPATAGPLSLGSAPINLANGSQIGLNFGSSLSTTGVATTPAGGTVGFVMTGTPAAQSYTLLNAASGLAAADYTVLNPTNFTFTVSKSDSSVSITTTPATALTTAFWKGGFGSSAWALSDGSTESNFTTDAAGAVNTPLTPGGATTVRFSGTGATNKTGQTLGAPIAVAGLVNDDTAVVSLTDSSNTLTIGSGGITQSASVGAAGGLTVATPVALTANQTWANNSTSPLSVGNANGGVISTTATLTLNAASGPITVAGPISTAAAVNVQGNSAVNLQGDLMAPAVNLTKTGNGTLTLSGANNSLQQLNLNSNSIIDIGSGMLTINNGGGNTIQSSTGGTINATGGGAIVLLAPSTGGPDNGTANGTTLTINAKITGPGAFEFFRSGVTTGVIVLNNPANDFNDNVLINAGIISVPSITNARVAGPLGRGTSINLSSGVLRYTGTGDSTDRVINLSNATASGTIDHSGTGLLRFTANFTATGAGSKTLFLTGSTAGIGEIAGAVVNNSATNITSVAKTGTGTWVLSGVSTYTGTTTVNAGTLLINGSVTSAVTLPAASASSTTLGGTGTITGPVAVEAGRLAPGNSPGVLDVVGSLTLGTASSSTTYAVEIGGALPGDGAANYDQVLVTGATTITSAALEAVMSNSFVPSSNDVFYILARGDAAPHASFFTGLPEGATYTFTDGSTAQITYAANWTGTQAGSALTGGNDVALYNFTPIPEPTALAAGAAVAGLLAMRRRRQSR